MFQETFNNLRVAEARNLIPAGSAFRATMAICMEAGTKQFSQAYYGADWARLSGAGAIDKAARENVGQATESYLSDISATRAVLRKTFTEANVSTDFPILLSNARKAAIREKYDTSESVLPSIATKRTVTNFRLIEGVDVSDFNDLEEQAEGEDVSFGKFAYTKDGYRVVLLSKAFNFTWQMWKNDDFGLFATFMTEMGKAARRTRPLAVANAIKDGLAAQTLGSAGGPDVAHLTAARQYQAELTEEGKKKPRRISDLLIPLKWQSEALTALNSQDLNRTGDKAGTFNPVYKTAEPHFDEVLSEVLGDDWVGYDRNRPFVELAVLDTFEGGPITVHQLPDVGSNPEMGSFSNNSMATKVADGCAAKVTNTKNAIRVKGS